MGTYRNFTRSYIFSDYTNFITLSKAKNMFVIQDLVDQDCSEDTSSWYYTLIIDGTTSRDPQFKNYLESWVKGPANRDWFARCCKPKGFWKYGKTYTMTLKPPHRVAPA